MHIPAIIWLVTVFLVGLGVGSFLNVLIARLPYEKSIIWPGSRCFACLQPIRLTDNLPIIGYLRLRGRCRNCGAPFSSRYLWVEIGTGIAFVVLFLIEVGTQAINGPLPGGAWHFTPGLQFFYSGSSASPPLHVWVYFVYHAILLSLLIAAAVIDAEHRIIPHHLTYVGTLIGLIGSVLMPWPWPTTDPAVLAQIPTNAAWILPENLGKIPTGATLWPFWHPLAWAPAGSWQLGLLNGIVGALAGTFIVRAVRFLFGVGFGQEPLGLGDADLLMMAGAFLGWPVAVMGFFVGAAAALVLQIPLMILDAINRRSVRRELSFGPGLAVGVVLVWFGWPWMAPFIQVLYDVTILGFIAIVIGGGLLISGLLLRRKA